MCSRFAQFRSARAYAEHFGVTLDPSHSVEVAGIRNVAPTDGAFVLRRHPETGALDLSVLRWGLVPVWAEDASRAARLINARSETVAEMPSFRGAWTKRRRCVVPVEGFYEWGRTAGGKPGAKTGTKTPYYIGLRGGAPVSLAGLWEGWKNPATGEWLRTFTILTCAPNALIGRLHDRMPVILREEDIPFYLEAEDPRALLAPFPDADMALQEIDSRAAKPGDRDALPRFG